MAPELELDRPPRSPRAAVLLTHGAGADRNSSVLTQVSDALTARGLLVARFDLAFRQKRPKGPPSPSGAAADRESLVRAAVELRQLAGDVPMIIGGQSYGGRQASMVAAESPTLADGLVLLSYPLHPPGKPDKLRTEHFPALRTPTVFVHGSSDPFATDDELAAAVESIAAPVHIVTVPAAGHDMPRSKNWSAALVAEQIEHYLLTRLHDCGDRCPKV